MSQTARTGVAPPVTLTTASPVRELNQADIESHSDVDVVFGVLCGMRMRMKDVWEAAQAAASPQPRRSRLSNPSDLLMGALRSLVGRMNVVKSVVSAAPNLSTVLSRSPARPQEIIEWHHQWSAVLTMLVSSQICTTNPTTANEIAEAVACVTDDLWPYIMEWHLAGLDLGHRRKLLLDLKSDFIDQAAQFSGGLDLLGAELRAGLPFTEELEDFLQEVVKGIQVINRTLRDELGKTLAELQSPGGGPSCFSSRWARMALFTTATLSRALSMIFGALSVANPPEDEESASDGGIRPMALARFITAGGALASIVGYSWLRERSLALLEAEKNLRAAGRDLLECQSLLQLLVVNTEPEARELPAQLPAQSMIADEAGVELRVDGLDEAHIEQEGSERPAALDEPNLQKWHEGIRHLAGEARKIVGPLAHGLESCNQLVELQEEPDCDPHTLGRALQVQERSLTSLVHRGESLTKRISELRESMENDHADGCCRHTRPFLALLQYSDGILAFLAFLGGGVDAFSSFSTGAVRGISITNTALDGFNNFVGLTRELAQSRAERHENTLTQLTEAYGELSRVVPLAGPLAKTYGLISRKLLESTRSPSVRSQASAVASVRTFRADSSGRDDSFGRALMRQDSLIAREGSGHFDLSQMSDLSISQEKPEDGGLGDDGEPLSPGRSTLITKVVTAMNEPQKPLCASGPALAEMTHRTEHEGELVPPSEESGGSSHTKIMPLGKILSAEHALIRPEFSVPAAQGFMTSGRSPNNNGPSGAERQGPSAGETQYLQALVRRARGLLPSASAQTVGKKR
ncbi:MAG: hypothetical protein ACOYKZ_06125 [Chlamydiia bacterium]